MSLVLTVPRLVTSGVFQRLLFALRVFQRHLFVCNTKCSLLSWRLLMASGTLQGLLCDACLCHSVRTVLAIVAVLASASGFGQLAPPGSTSWRVSFRGDQRCFVRGRAFVACRQPQAVNRLLVAPALFLWPLPSRPGRRRGALAVVHGTA